MTAAKAISTTRLPPHYRAMLMTMMFDQRYTCTTSILYQARASLRPCTSTGVISLGAPLEPLARLGASPRVRIPASARLIPLRDPALAPVSRPLRRLTRIRPPKRADWKNCRAAPPRRTVHARRQANARHNGALVPRNGSH
ncbi:unnamed protein product, partial [Iphiclides podalirius]